MHGSLRVLGLTGSRREISLQLMLRILKVGLYSLHLALLIYISIIYTLICLYLINIRLLIRLNTTKLLLRILIIIRILLLTGYITALIYLGSTCLQVYLYQHFIRVPRSQRPPGRILIFLIVLIILAGSQQAPSRIIIS